MAAKIPIPATMFSSVEIIVYCSLNQQSHIPSQIPHCHAPKLRHTRPEPFCQYIFRKLRLRLPHMRLVHRMHMPVGLVIRAAKAGHNLRAAVFHTGVLIGAAQHVEAHFLLLCSYPISPKTAVLSKGAFCHFCKELRYQLIQARYPHCPSNFCTNTSMHLL